MASTFDRTAIELRVLAVTRDLLREIGNAPAVVQGSSTLERDLGLGSIERIELASRLDRALGIALPENAVADASTLDDIVTAIAGPAGTAGGEPSLQPAFESPTDDRGTPPSAEPGNARAAKTKPARLRRAWEIVYGIYAAGVFFVWLVIAWLTVLAMPRGRATARMTSVALRIYFALIGCRITLEGADHIRAHGASIYVSNHTSYSDVLVVLALFNTDYHFIAKSEISRMPFIGTFLRKRGDFAFDRTKLHARSRQIEQMEHALLHGESVFVFAEGTFTAQPGVRPFQLGAFRVAVKTRRPIIPVALRGTRRFLQDGTYLPRPSRIQVTVCPPLHPASSETGTDFTEILRLRDETRLAISNHSGEPMLNLPCVSSSRAPATR